MLMLKDKASLSFIFLLAIIYWMAYFTVVSMGNVFQAYIFEHHLSPALYPELNIMAFRIALLGTVLMYLKRLQSIQSQRWLFIFVVLLLALGLSMPISLGLYPFITGLERIVTSLIQPWIQLFVPAAFRATVSGTIMGGTGVLDFLSAMIETSWSWHLSRYHYLTIFFGVAMILFWRLSYTEEKRINIVEKQSPQNLSTLLTQHPYIFIACFLGGLNTAIFGYTFLLAKEVLPQMSTQDYQYMLYLGGIIGPIVVGRLADKKGIFRMLIFFACWLVVNKLLQALCITISSKPAAYYITAFMESGLAVSVSTLGLALIGERLKTQGIFRAFAVSNVFFYVGNLAASRIYKYFVDSFFLTNLSMGLVNIFFILLLWKFYHKENKS